MIQFQVPQFIETEDKLIGPMSLRQFAYVGTAAVVSGILLFVLNIGLWILITIILGGIGTFLAFGKFNGRPIAIFIKSLFQNIWSPSIYIFKPKSAEVIKELPSSKIPAPKRTITISKPDFGGIKNLWTKLNTSKAAIPHREKPLPSQTEPFFSGVKNDRFEAVRHITGEREVAKRVDYRS
ncbi:MAG: PrgI family protein [Candidatus Colwellbacteria bacterium]|nr:PrgI family protein [Candidatus Colwellbacteria bacterium]